MITDSFTFNVGVAVFLVAVAAAVVKRSRRRAGLHDIPTLGCSLPILSYLDGIRTRLDIIPRLREGSSKYADGFFKLPFPGIWIVTTANSKYIEELRKANDETMSFAESMQELLPLSVFANVDPIQRRYHVQVARNNLTKNLDRLFPAVREEIANSFERAVPLSEEWTEKPAWKLATDIVCRTSNRVLVGVPLCRDAEYLTLITSLVKNVVQGSAVSNLAPPFLKPFFQWFFIDNTTLNRCSEILSSHIEDRQQLVRLHGPNYPHKRVDVLSWLIDEAEGDERTPKNLTFSLFTLFFASLHTTSTTFTQALFHIATRPDLVPPLRAEIERILGQEGWSKSAFDKMPKLDSLFRDTMHFTGMSIFGLQRKVLREFSFSDGTTVPPGSFVLSLRKEMLERDADVPAFSDITSEPPPASNGKRDMVATSASATHFGHGRRACPGRFFAAMEMKMMMAYLLTSYDVRMGGSAVEEVRQAVWVGQSRVPNPKATVWFRRRAV